jgi:hypothetical protein
MSWWDDLNRLKDETITSLNNAVTSVTGTSNDFLATVIPPSTQKATSTTVSQPVAGVNLPQSSGVNNNMLVIGVAALIASLYFLKKG